MCCLLAGVAAHCCRSVVEFDSLCLSDNTLVGREKDASLPIGGGGGPGSPRGLRWLFEGEHLATSHQKLEPWLSIWSSRLLGPLIYTFTRLCI